MLTLLDDMGITTIPSKSKTRQRYGNYKCDCGGTEVFATSLVKNGYRVQCAKCDTQMYIDVLGENYSALKKTWYHIKDRCHNKDSKNYPKYGGKGIFMCQEWRDDFKVFEKWAIANGYTEEPKVQFDKDFKAWALDKTAEYSPTGTIIILAGKNAELKRRLM
jgi:hypothetical protein